MKTETEIEIARAVESALAEGTPEAALELREAIDVLTEALSKLKDRFRAKAAMIDPKIAHVWSSDDVTVRVTPERTVFMVQPKVTVAKAKQVLGEHFPLYFEVKETLSVVTDNVEGLPSNDAFFGLVRMATRNSQVTLIRKESPCSHE